ncbi:AAA family ATPase [Halogranum rubrum]|uniref:AAA+ ATPase domain-containing protein n=1 Tax=Halogranum salarium B-1 TaxID=1210908 RepID=J2ZXP6_9EURY|nr:MoxR family ATPase [Halogranum salarium]EJN57793.1 hypothetical protein HSB1_38780 [Halogranum salarium B-1]
MPEGDRNDSNFDNLSVGDYILFYRKGTFFAAGRISETLRSRDVGGYIWDNRPSWNVFFIEDYCLLDLPRSEMWEYLGYSQNFDMRGFRRVPPERLDGVWEGGFETLKAFIDHYRVETPQIPGLKGTHPTIHDDWDNGSRITKALTDLELTTSATIDELLETVLTSDAEPTVYWVNQSDESEVEGFPSDPQLAYLSASVDGIWHHDLSQVAVGDIIVHNYDGEIIGLSRVLVSEVTLKLNGSDRYVVPVDLCRFDEPISRTQLTKAIVHEDLPWDDLPFFLNPQQGYLIDLDTAALRALFEKLFETTPSSSLSEYLDPLRVDIELPSELYFDDKDELKKDLEAALNAGKHVILTGPPGTGKSKIAKAVAEQCSTLPQVDGYRFVTATSDMTTYDTIGGYVPNRSAEGDELEFRPRQFLQCFRDDGVKNDWLIIDEINRANIDKAFGQLFSVLSGDSVELPYEDDGTVRIEWIDAAASDERQTRAASNANVYPVTPSWRLLATMNTQDKASLYEMSFAFMRRFNFIHVGLPELSTGGEIRASLLNPESNDGYAAGWSNSYSGPGDLKSTLKSGHQDIAIVWAVINEERPIGPSIVMDIAEYIAAYDGEFEEALTRAIVSLVFPQLEGLHPDTQQSVLLALDSSHSVDTATQSVTPAIDFETLYRKANDFFGIDVDPDDE